MHFHVKTTQLQTFLDFCECGTWIHNLKTHIFFNSCFYGSVNSTLDCKLKWWNIHISYLLYNVLLIPNWGAENRNKIRTNSQHHHMVGRNYFEQLIWRWSFHIKIQLCKWDPDQEKWNEPHSNHIKAFVLWFLKHSQKVADSNS